MNFTYSKVDELVLQMIIKVTFHYSLLNYSLIPFLLISVNCSLIFLQHKIKK
jgi:hypothetical protein